MLAVSTLNSTRFYSLVNIRLGTIEELDDDSYPGFSHEPSLAIANVCSEITPVPGGSGLYNDSQCVVQVTSTSVLLVNVFTGMLEAIWNRETEIVAASVNASQVAVALKGGKLVTLGIREMQFVELRYVFQQLYDTACCYSLWLVIVSSKTRKLRH